MRIWGISEVSRYVRQVLDDDANLRELWVEGELSNFTVSMSGHAYFTLKDSASQLKCVIFRQHLSRIRQKPQNGDIIVARGPLRAYEAQGIYQLYVDFFAPAGLGEQQLRLEELRLRLEAEGLFEPSRKRPLPAWPMRVGVATSATGAVIHDIRTVIARRFPLAEIILAPTPVQGDDAAAKIAQALQDLNRFGDVDVIILARGGGSAEDLGPFNEELVARAVFASRAPIVSAIGHETNVTISDLVADQRAPTPSAAAELVVPDIREIREQVARFTLTLRVETQRALLISRSGVDQLEAALVQRSPSEHVAQDRRAVAALFSRAAIAARHQLELMSGRVTARQLQLGALDPHGILNRGYSLAWRVNTGELIRGVAQVESGVRVRTELAEGSFESTVRSITAG